jgi:ketoreductase RED1
MIENVAVVGAGTIGGAWATLFAARGLRVTVTDPRSDAAEAVERSVRQFAPTLPEGPADADELLARISVEPGLEEAVAGADLVQENGPEDLDLKRGLFDRIAAAAPEHAVLATSTSGLMPTAIAADLPDAAAARLLVAHPFNPPHLLPLVELVAGERTARSTVETATEFYRALGKTPVALRKEVPGFVANRLQSAIFRECVHLVLSGVVDVAELDAIVTNSLGVRWASDGPFLSLHLGGGPGGLRHLLEHLGPGMARRWADLGRPDLDPETVEAIGDATEHAYGDHGYPELAEDRDRREIAVLSALAAEGARP